MQIKEGSLGKCPRGMNAVQNEMKIMPAVKISVVSLRHGAYQKADCLYSSEHRLSIVFSMQDFGTGIAVAKQIP